MSAFRYPLRMPTSAMIPIGHGGYGGLALVFVKDFSLLDELPPDSRGRLFRPAPDWRHKGVLFLEMAAVELTPEGLARFRERFGTLPTEGCAMVVETATGRVVYRVPQCHPALPPDEQLRQEILTMRECVLLRKMIRTGDTDGLRRHVRWEAEPGGGLSVAYYGTQDAGRGEPDPSRELVKSRVIASTSFCPERFGEMVPGDVLRPARLYLEQVANEHIEGRVVTRYWLGEKGPRELHLPKDVLGGIWHQFASGPWSMEYEQCKKCGDWFILTSVGRGRKDRQYCSTACKVKAYRDRKEQALRLHAQGKRAQTIANELGSELRTVKGWISAARKEKRRDG